MQRPTLEHYKHGLHILGFLVKSKNLGITYGGALKVPMGLESASPNFYSSAGLHTYSDSSWGKTPRPMAGYVIMLNNGMVDWSARMMRVVADSTCEAETAIASKASKATIFVRHLMSAMHSPPQGPSPLLVDNTALVAVVMKEGASSRTRYYDRATTLVKDHWMRKIVDVIFVTTDKEVADIFTKATDSNTFFRMAQYIYNCSFDISEIGNRSRVSELNRKLNNLVQQLNTLTGPVSTVTQ